MLAMGRICKAHVHLDLMGKGNGTHECTQSLDMVILCHIYLTLCLSSLCPILDCVPFQFMSFQFVSLSSLCFSSLSLIPACVLFQFMSFQFVTRSSLCLSSLSLIPACAFIAYVQEITSFYLMSFQLMSVQLVSFQLKTFQLVSFQLGFFKLCLYCLGLSRLCLCAGVPWIII